MYHKDIKYDFTAELAETGDRSECDIEDYCESDTLFSIKIYGHRGSAEPAFVITLID